MSYGHGIIGKKGNGMKMDKFFIELFEKADNEEYAREVKGDGEIGH